MLWWKNLRKLYVDRVNLKQWPRNTIYFTIVLNVKLSRNLMSNYRNALRLFMINYLRVSFCGRWSINLVNGVYFFELGAHWGFSVGQLVVIYFMHLKFPVLEMGKRLFIHHRIPIFTNLYLVGCPSFYPWHKKR